MCGSNTPELDHKSTTDDNKTFDFDAPHRNIHEEMQMITCASTHESRDTPEIDRQTGRQTQTDR